MQIAIICDMKKGKKLSYQREGMQRNCIVCGATFTSIRADASFHNATCRQRWNRAIKAGKPLQRHPLALPRGYVSVNRYYRGRRP